MALENIGKDIKGTPDYTLPIPVSCYSMVLDANTVETITTPPNTNRVFFSYQPGITAYVTMDGTAPIAPVATGASTQEMNPAGRQSNVNGGTVIKAISAVNTVIGVRFDFVNTGIS